MLAVWLDGLQAQRETLSPNQGGKQPRKALWPACVYAQLHLPTAVSMHSYTHPQLCWCTANCDHHVRRGRLCCSYLLILHFHSVLSASLCHLLLLDALSLLHLYSHVSFSSISIISLWRSCLLPLSLLTGPGRSCGWWLSRWSMVHALRQWEDLFRSCAASSTGLTRGHGSLYTGHPRRLHHPQACSLSLCAFCL